MIIRNHYRAQLTQGCADITAAVENCRSNAQQLIYEEKMLTVALYHYENMLFLYYEEIKDDADAEETAVDSFMAPLAPMLENWPADGSKVKWMKMFHIYYHNVPESVEQWQQDRHPEHRRGRIAKLREDKLFEYVYHHVAIVNEGLLRGDKYQSIALYGDILFSYFEEPRSSVNIKGDYEHESEAINEWLAVDPESHFIPFPEANGANFLIMPEYFALNRSAVVAVSHGNAHHGDANALKHGIF